MEFKKLFLLPLVLSIFACSSDDDEGTTSTETETSSPTVTLSIINGNIQNEQSNISLTGAAAGADTFTYAWAISDDTIIITHEDTSAPDASLTTPEVRTSSVEVTLTLTATAADGGSAAATQVMTINPVNAEPEASVAVTQDSRFAENTFGGALLVTMTGSGTDSDPIDANNPISAFAWQQTSGTDMTAGLALDQAVLAFTSPALNVSETFVFELTVTDNEGATDTEEVSITVLDVTQTPPIAEAGNAITVMEGERFLLTGSATSLTTTAQPFLFEWVNNSSDLADFSDATDESTYAAAPAVTANTDITIELRVVDQFNNEDQDQIVVTVRDLPVSLLNDTGVTSNISDSALVNGASHDFPGQDSDFGRDRIGASGVLQKAGTGDSGFDFTKLDELGDETEFASTDWNCVRDNVTGLVWEVKANDNGLHDRDYLFSWVADLSDDTLLNDAATCNITNCDTASFVQAVNAEGLCGFFDWRLPTHNELMSIMDFSNVDGAFVDSDFFPNNSPDITNTTWYWTSQQNADGTSGETIQNSWAIDFTSGNDNFLLKSREIHLRLVRAGR